MAQKTITRGKINAPTAALTASVLGRIVYRLRRNDPTCRKVPHSTTNEKTRAYAFVVGYSPQESVVLIASRARKKRSSLYANINVRKTLRAVARGAASKGDSVGQFVKSAIANKRNGALRQRGNVNQRTCVFVVAGNLLGQANLSVTAAQVRLTQKRVLSEGDGSQREYAPIAANVPLETVCCCANHV